MVCSAIWTANFAIQSNIHMLALRGASIDLIGTNMSDENLVQVMLANKFFVFRMVRTSLLKGQSRTPDILVYKAIFIHVKVTDHTSGDLNYQFCPLGKNRIRVAGFADFVGEQNPDKEFMRKVFVDQTKYLFPDLKWTSETPLWHGFRPMSPDNLPYVGKDCKTSNLYISCGHGSSGWTTSSGTGKLLSRVIHADLNLKHLTEDEKKISTLLCPNRFNNFPLTPKMARVVSRVFDSLLPRTIFGSNYHLEYAPRSKTK